MRLTNEDSRPVDVALCVDEAALVRLRPVLRHLCVALVDHPVRLRLLSSTREIEALTLGPVQAVVHRRIRWPVAARRFAELIEGLRADAPDVIHAASAESFDLASELARALDAELLLDISSLTDVERTARLVALRSPHLIAFSEPLVELLLRIRTVAPGCVDLVRPGVIASKETACFADAQRRPTIVSVHPLSRETRAGALITALARLRDEGLEFSAFLLGQGSGEPGLRRQVRGERLTTHVTFAALQAGIGDVFEEADILAVCQPLQEVSIRVLQAMAAGMLVVAPPTAVHDALKPNETALIVSDGSPAALAAGLREALTDRERARRLAEAGQIYVREHHTVSAMAERTAEVYRRVRAHAAA